MTVRAVVILGCLVCLSGAMATAGRVKEAASARNGLLVYWTESPWPRIWSSWTDGTHRRVILRSHQNAKRPRLSPDRKWVAFDGTPPGQLPLTNFDIQLVQIDGRDRQTLVKTRDAWELDAQWSPDGTELSFSRQQPYPVDERTSTIWVVGRDGSGLQELGPGSSARWSPDGTKLVYEGTEASSLGDLYVVNADGTGNHLLLASPGLDHPAGWSREDRILFTRSFDQSARRGSIFVVDADGSGLHRVGRGFAAAWSPDGSKILYSLSVPGPLYIMNADGSHKRLVVNVVAWEPDWR